MKIDHVYKDDEVEVYATPHTGRVFRNPVTKRDCEDLVSQIKRHCDVDQVSVRGKTVYVTEDGNEHDNIVDALVDEMNEHEYNFGFTIRYERPSDGTHNGKPIGTRTSASSFQEVVEEAWRCPYAFEVVTGDLTDRQREFLGKVIEYSKIMKLQKQPNRNNVIKD